MRFLIFDILSTMYSLPYYKPLCFSFSYLNIKYFLVLVSFESQLSFPFLSHFVPEVFSPSEIKDK